MLWRLTGVEHPGSQFGVVVGSFPWVAMYTAKRAIDLTGPAASAVGCEPLNDYDALVCAFVGFVVGPGRQSTAIGRAHILWSI